VTGFGYVQLWDVRTDSPKAPPLRAPGSDGIDFWLAAFSPDGSTLATGGAIWGPPDTGAIFLWNAATGQPIGRLPEEGNPVSAMSFSPGGTTLVSSTGYGHPPVGEVIVWNLERSQAERTIHHADDSGVLSADMSNDGTTLVTGGQSGRERLWDLSTGQPIGPAFDGPASTVDLSRDGRTVAAAGQGQAVMWDVATGTVLGQSFFPGVGPDDNLTAAFTPDGRRLFVLSDTGDAWVWDVDPASWERRACQIAGRSLTESEWQLYLPNRPYRVTCGS
jgi:WD40 repeat protein